MPVTRTIAIVAVPLVIVGCASQTTSRAQLAPTVAPTPAAPAPDDPVIGTIDERSVRASEIINPIDDELRELAAGVDRDTFVTRARPLLKEELQKLTLDTLLYKDAIAHLTDDERAAVDEYSADEGTRRQLLLRRHRRVLFGDLIEPTEDETRRLYERRADRYHIPTKRVVRMIRTPDPAAADRVDAALTAGRPFGEVASSPDNTYRRAQGGRMPVPIIGDDAFVPALNDALRAIDAGERSRRLALQGGFAWIAVEDVTPGRTIPFEDARDELRTELRQRRSTELQNEYIQGLLDTADYTDLATMTDSALRIAVRRYAPKNRQLSRH